MNDIFFSIVIPTHNRPHLLQRALASIAAQDFFDYEIIIVNDGSTVSYQEVQDQFRDRPATFITHESSKGVSSARNSGILASRGKWVTFLDDDDEYNLGFLSSMHRCLTSPGESAAFAWTSVEIRHHDEAKRTTKLEHRIYPQHFASDLELCETAVRIGAGFGLAVKRECFDRAGLFDTTLHFGEDTEFIFRLLKCGYRPAICPGVGITIHSNVLTRHGSFKGLRRRVDAKVFERIASSHLDFIKTSPDLLTHFLGDSAVGHYVCRDFASGDRLLMSMLRSAPFNPHVWLSFFKGALSRVIFRFTPLFLKQVTA
jgi:glycosyltransferase involved in cell wall biosynthesis